MSPHLCQGSDEMCECGCRGWCTLYPLLLEWVEDLKRLEHGDKVRYAVLDIQGDWPAFLQVFGLRYWNHKTHPCPLCRINQEQLSEANLNETTLDSLPYDVYTSDDYRRDVNACVKATSINYFLVHVLVMGKSWGFNFLRSALNEFGGSALGA